MKDMQVRSRPDTTPTLRLRADPALPDVNRFDTMTSLLGYSTDVLRAQLLGCHPRTIRRARRGDFGSDFMAKSLAALQQYRDRLAQFNLTPTLDELYEVDPATVEAA